MRENYRTIDVKLASGKEIKNVSYEEIDHYIMMIKYGEEDFIILNSENGFLQFYGIGNEYIAEVWIYFDDEDFCCYSLINSDKKDKLERVKFSTPYGDFTPMERDIVSLELITAAVKEYYKNIDMQDFCKTIPVVDTTKEMKKLMGRKN